MHCLPAQLVCICLALLPSISARQQPAKRFYDSHEYYVLELASHDVELARRTAFDLQAELVEQVGELESHFLLRAPKGNSAFKRDVVLEQYDIFQRKRSISPIVSLEKQQLKKRVKRVYPDETDTPSDLGFVRQKRQPAPFVSEYLQDIVKRFSIFDPVFPKQWHLANDRSHEKSINVTGVWAEGITGDGIKVAIVDDGLDMHSDDLADNFYPEGSWDYNDHTPLPEPRLSDDQHGTRCAGEIGAVKNDVCGVGVAHTCKIAGIRILSASISDADEASALNYGYQDNDIYSCSWGPPDDGKSTEGPSRLIKKAMLNGVTNGRGGKGSIFVFASGNGGAVDDQCNFDGYTNSQYSITVGAIDREGLHPFYSEACSAVMIVTYSSGSGDNIHTTDVGKRTCTSRHGGTSAAAPIAAGIFALVLQARPELTWRDMQHLCVRTAVVVNKNDPDWTTTQAGRPFNHKYGYGKLDTWAIVNAAKTWDLVNPQAWWQSNVTSASPTGAVALTPEGISSEIAVSGQDLQAANLAALEHITVTVEIPHQRRGNIEVELKSPNGILSSLARIRRFDEAKEGLNNWQFMSVKHWDENPVGIWTLKVTDRQQNGKNGTFANWKLALWGSSLDASIATPYKLPHDEQILLPPSPTVTAEEPDETGNEGSEEDMGDTEDEDVLTSIAEALPTATEDAAPTPIHPATSKTKQFAKPTDHLPDDHGEAVGESHLPLDPTIPTQTASSTPQEEEEKAEDPVTFLGSVTNLASNQTWLFIAGGTALIFAGTLTAFFLLRRARQTKGDRPGYDFAPVPGEEGGSLPMSALESGRLAPGRTSGGKTRDLYDAFGVSSDSEDEMDDEKGMTRFKDEGQQFKLQDSDDDDEKMPSRTASAAANRSTEELYKDNK